MPFTNLRFLIPTRHIRDERKRLEYLARVGVEHSKRVRTLSGLFKCLLRFVSLPVMLKDDNRKKLILNEEFKNASEWKAWWCANLLVYNIARNRKIVNPTHEYRFPMPPKARKNLEQMMKTANKLSSIKVPICLSNKLRTTDRIIEHLP